MYIVSKITMSEFYPDYDSDVAPMTKSTDVLAALVKQNGSYMSSSAPGTMRSFEIPIYDLLIDEDWNIKSYKSYNKNYVRAPSQIYKLHESHITELNTLAAAKKTLDAAVAAYNVAKTMFRESITGKWIDDILIPDKPLPEVLEARIPADEIRVLIDKVKTYSMNPLEEEITLNPEFYGYNNVSIEIVLKIGIHKTEYRKLNAELTKGCGMSCKDGIVYSVTVEYGGYYPPYRLHDMKELDIHNKVTADAAQEKKTPYKKNGIRIPLFKMPYISEEDHAKYVDVATAVQKSY